MRDVIRIVTGGLAVLAGIAAEMLGGWDAAVKTLLVFMALDYITGVIVAGVFKNSEKTDDGSLSSRAGFKGLCRKFAVLALVLLAASLDTVMDDGSYVRNTVIFFFCANEGLSILENVGLMGVEYPQKLKNMLSALKK